MKFTERKLLCIAGSTKCGTTTLFDLLNQSDIIDGAVRKETRYFMSEKYPLPRIYNYSIGAKDYEKFFKGKNINSVLLDASPDYMYCNEAIKRINKEFKNSFVVVILRDPADRFVSWFNYAKQIGKIDENLTVREFLSIQLDNVNLSEEQVKNALAQGEYSKFVEKIEHEFSDRFLIVSFEEFKDNPKKVIRKIATLIGENINVDEIKYDVSNKTINVKNQKLYNAYSNLREYFGSKTAFFPFIHRFGKKIRITIDFFMHRYNTKETIKDNIDEEVKDYLTKYYAFERNWLKDKL